MIDVSIRKDELRVSGHAGYSLSGLDIVCAGVTAQVNELVLSLKNLTDDVPVYAIEPGEFILKIKDLSEIGKLLVDSFFCGICNIIDAFPDNVRIV